jgi:mRNA-degrading endonuclease toxin of MazEF toxin-antitoxin module
MCEAVRAVSTARFGRLISTAARQTVDQVTAKLTLWPAG